MILSDLKIRKFSTIVDKFASSTANALLLINMEMVSIRSMVLQNRLVRPSTHKRGRSRMLKVQQSCIYIRYESQDLDTYIQDIFGLMKNLGRVKSTRSLESYQKRIVCCGKMVWKFDKWNIGCCLEAQSDNCSLCDIPVIDHQEYRYVQVRQGVKRKRADVELEESQDIYYNDIKPLEDSRQKMIKTTQF